jgi:SP family arabinose:H+ symporter-like MFS transporter
LKNQHKIVDAFENGTGGGLPEESISGRVFFWALTSALAGFLFGFDTVVISGAEQKIQALWGLSDTVHGIAMASALYGTVIGAFIGAWPTDRFGRRATLRSLGIIYLISAIGSALAPNVSIFILARLIGGLGIGISTVVAPLYISEIAPPKYRGRLAGMFQFNIVFGIIVADTSNWLLSGIGENAWRWMLGVAAFPSLVYAVFCLGIPESPRWLLTRKKDRPGGIAVLRQIQPNVSEVNLNSLADEIAITGKIQSAGNFWTKQFRTPILLAFLIAFFNQLSGINAVLYFAPRIFELAGLGQNAALLQTIGVGVTNFIFTFAGLWLIDRAGRRFLLYLGSFGYIIFLGLIAWAFFSKHYAIVPACVFAFIAAHAVGQGAVIWVYLSEIFPTRYRAAGQTLGSSTHWFFAALLTTCFPRAVTHFQPGYVFLFFCGMMVLQLIWVKTMVVETKGVPLEQVQKRLGIA